MEILSTGFREFTLNGYFIFFKLPLSKTNYAIRLDHLQGPIVLQENRKYDCLMMPSTTFRNETLPRIWETTKFLRFRIFFLKCGMSTQDGTTKLVNLPKEMRKQIHDFLLSGAKREDGYKELAKNWWHDFEGLNSS